MEAPKRVPGQENVVVRGSRVHGRGLFATRRLQVGDRVIEYVGEKVTKAESTRRTWAQWERGRVYTFELNARYDIDGSPKWNRARYANHSCDPNSETQIIRGHIWVIAIKPIEAGQEITYDYQFPLDDELQACRCGEPNCIGFIVAAEHRPKLRRRLRRKGK